MASVFEVESSALRHIIANPLGTRRRSHENDARELADIVEHHMIPRLMLAHSREKTSPLVEDLGPLSPKFADEFAINLLDWDADRALREVEGLVKHGYGIQAIFLDLLAPAARKLGALWEEDRCDFVDYRKSCAKSLRARRRSNALCADRHALCSPPCRATSTGSVRS